MSTIKWWKDRFWLTLMTILLGTVAIAFLFAYFFEWGWIVAIATAIIGGLFARKLIIPKLNEFAEKLRLESEQYKNKHIH